MFWKVVSVAAFAAVSAPFAAQAQSLAQIGGPAELPPNSFRGDQYVDSRGCVFLRAGNGGQLNWVPRVTRARKVLCGFPPTLGAKPVIEMADETAPVAPRVVVAEAAPARAPVVIERRVGRPMETIASLPATRLPVTRRVAAPAAVPVAIEAVPVRTVRTQGYETASSTGVPTGKIGCYTSAPVAERVSLRNGGTAVVCTRGDGTVTGWRPPVYPDGIRVGASLANPPVAVYVGRGRVDVRQEPAADYAQVENSAPVMPKGYRAAWTDDRLNPNRGRGTAEGQAAQDQIWTRDVPAQLVTDKAKKKARKKKNVSVSTSNSATESTGRLWVQVGTFGVKANAAGAAQTLAGLGLPTAKSRITKGGKALEIVLAGPFGSATEAKAALSIARKAGFGDAILR